jgi:hypothetical protein
LVACWMTPHCVRAVRERGGVVQSDLLQLVPICIPDNGAPQLRTSKMSPSTRLWAQFFDSMTTETAAPAAPISGTLFVLHLDGDAAALAALLGVAPETSAPIPTHLLCANDVGSPFQPPILAGLACGVTCCSKCNKSRILVCLFGSSGSGTSESELHGKCKRNSEYCFKQRRAHVSQHDNVGIGDSQFCKALRNLHSHIQSNSNGNNFSPNSYLSCRDRMK